jgi:hypothetical protein
MRRGKPERERWTGDCEQAFQQLQDTLLRQLHSFRDAYLPRTADHLADFLSRHSSDLSESTPVSQATLNPAAPTFVPAAQGNPVASAAH